MRALFLAAVAAAALWSLPAEGLTGNVWPYFGFSYGFGPYPYARGTARESASASTSAAVPVHRQPAPAPAAQGVLKLYVYPAAGQSEAQTADDRYQCHAWAANESGHDPTLGAGSRDEADSYTRAFTACMEGRNYVVR